MANIRNLFDFQKIAENADLAEVIGSVEKKYGVALSDDELELAAAGANVSNNTVMHHCDKCNALREFKCSSGGRAICLQCGTQILL